MDSFLIFFNGYNDCINFSVCMCRQSPDSPIQHFLNRRRKKTRKNWILTKAPSINLFLSYPSSFDVSMSYLSLCSETDKEVFDDN